VPQIVEVGDPPVKVAVYAAECPTGFCLIMAYVLDGRPRISVVPAQPHPLCRVADRVEAYVIHRAVETILPNADRHLLPCTVSERLLRKTLDETIEALKSVGIIRGLSE
jgi:hypothetical protein